MRNNTVTDPESKSILRFFAVIALILFIGISNNTFAQEPPVEGEDEPATTEEPAAEDEDAAAEESPILQDQASINAGKELFANKCASCHHAEMSKPNAAYPMLAGVIDRVPGSNVQERVDWLRKWIPNAPGMIATDDYAKKLFKDYNGVVMTAFGDLTPDQVNQLIAYIYTGGEKPVDIKKDDNGPVTVEQDDSNLIMILGVVLVALILIIGVLVLLATHLQKSLNDKDGLKDEDKKIVNQKHDVLKVIKHPVFYGIVIALLLGAGTVALVQKGLYGIGVQTGYAPVQPIPFSHKIHAGQYKIDCNYCHTGVRKSKHANIPSPNICMNCHKAVATNKEWIKELYGYVERNEPIKWTRVHNLPDLAYFNHAQHVKVAGLECQECHGPVEEMETMYQYSTLTMGWCIDCHRKTPLNLDAYDNESGYYTRELAEKLYDFRNKKISDYAMEQAQVAMDSTGAPFHEVFEGLKDPLTVQDIGGMECSKCHY